MITYEKDLKPYHEKYVYKILKEYEGCTTEYAINCAVWPAFIELIYHFPEAYKHMLKVWGVSDEDN